MKMRMAICNEMFVDRSLDRAFATARECGYTGIEIAPFTLSDDEPHHVSGIGNARRSEVRRAAQQAGLDVIGLHWLLAKTQGLHLTSPDSEVRRRTADYVCQLARLCRDLGGRIMVFGSPAQRNLADGITHEAGMAFAADVLCSAMPTCEQQDVVIAVEPLGPAEGNFLLTAESGIELVKRVDSPHCRLHLDCKAMSTESRTVAEVIRGSRDWMVHFHANDPNLLGPGMGDLDFHPIFEALRDIDYRGWISVEVFDYAPGPDKIARDSMSYLQSVLADLQRDGPQTNKS